MATPFSDLDDYNNLPRLSGLAISPEGSRLVTTVATINEDRTKFTTALWEIDPAGDRPARRLTHGLTGESAPVFTASGDLLFTAARATDGDEEGERAKLWRLPTAGGEAHVICDLAGGVSSVICARGRDTLVITAELLPEATSVEEDRELRKTRKDTKVEAILHTGYPIRFWDHDLGPGYPHLLQLPLTAEEGPAADLRDLTPAPGAHLVETDVAISPDAATVATTWNQPVGRADQRSVLATIDTATGQRRTIFDDGEADAPTFSPDGQHLAFIRSTVPDPHTAPRLSVYLAQADGTRARDLAPEWDLWPSSIAWLPDSSGLVVTADANGRGPVFIISLTGDVRQLTTTDATYTSVVADPGGECLYAVETSYAIPGRVVRIDLRDGRVTPLRGPHPLPELPGILRDVEASSSDGTRIRSWLALPHGASADNPAPLLLWIHGGPLNSWNAWSWRWNPWIAVAQGYAVLLPDPALSTGYGQDFIQRGWGAWGKAPYTDLMAATDAAEALPEIDASRTAAMGGSFGGYMANWIAGQTNRFDAIVTHASLWNLHSFGPTTDASFYWAKEMTEEMAAENSPHAHVRNIVTPMLVIHGDKDYRVPIGEGLALWYELLAESGLPMADDGTTPHRFLYFPNENHWVLTPQHAKVWYETVLDFLAEHVGGASLHR